MRVAVKDNFAYLTTYTNGLSVVDVTNPARPVEVYWTPTADFFFGVAVSNNLLFVAEGVRGVRILDITNPARPVFVHQLL